MQAVVRDVIKPGNRFRRKTGYDILKTSMKDRISYIALAFIMCIRPAISSASEAGNDLSVIRFTADQRPIYTSAQRSRSRDKKPRLGVALAGGGARAAASLGVLKVFEREGIKISALAGTSMGAIIGGLFAAGYTADEVEGMLLENNWNDIFQDTPSRIFLTPEQKKTDTRHLIELNFIGGRFTPPTGLSAGQKLAAMLSKKTIAASFEAGHDFDRLVIPFRAVATDVETGEPEAIGKGPLHEAIRASAAIPFIFQPVEVNGRFYFDGGASNNLPVDVVRAMGADIVIAVDPSDKPQKGRPQSLFDMANRVITLQVRKESMRRAGLADIIIPPDVSAYSFTDFSRMKEIIKIGEDAALAALPRIRELMLNWTMRPDERRYRISRFTISGNRTVRDEDIMKVLPADMELSTADIENLLAAIYDMGVFEQAALDLVKDGTGYSARLSVLENPVVSGIEITGNSLIPTDEIMSELHWQIKQPLDSAALSRKLDRIMDKWRRQGYILARVEQVNIRRDGVLEIRIYEGKVDDIKLIGQRRTRPSLVRRETATILGQPLNIKTLEEDIQHLYALGYFEYIALGIEDSGRGGLVLVFKVKERSRGRVRLGLWYDLEDSFTGLTDMIFDNVTGRGIRLYLNTRYGNYTDITLGYHSPVLLRTRFLHTIEGFYRRRTYDIYQNKNQAAGIEIARTGMDISFGYQWLRTGDIHIRYRYTEDRMAPVFGSAPEEDIHIGSLAFISTIDTLDRHPFARKGILFKCAYETASEAYGSSMEFKKASVSGQFNIPMKEGHILIIEAAGGAGSGDMPYHEKFGIGGADYLISYPLLGYRRREFVGTNLLAFSAGYRVKLTEYQLKLIRAVYLNLAAQAANVWDTRDAVSIRDLRRGVGIGIYADTIIGPFRLDIGAGEENRFELYFSAGIDF